MNFITYLLQVSGCITLFYLFYYGCLRRLTFFTINRYYLLSSLLLSYVIPLITIAVHPDYPIAAVTHFTQVPVVYQVFKPALATKHITAQASPITWAIVLKAVYAGITLILFLRFVVTLISFFVNLKKQKVETIGDIRIIHSDEKLKNGSFLNYIFLNDISLKNNEAEQVIAHEMLHVNLRHSIDRILGHIAKVILWFNPVVYLYTRAIEQNHEFEVDSRLTETTDKQNYAGLLLHLSVNARGAVYNSFAKTPLQRRIVMLFNKRSANALRVVYLLMLPVLLLSCMAFATFKTDKVAAALPRKFKQAGLDGAAYLEKPAITLASVVDKQRIKPTDPDNAAVIKSVAEAASENIVHKPAVADSTPRYSVINGLEKLGKAPLVLIDGKEYPSDILYTIGSACIRGWGLFLPEGAVKRFGPKAADGCVQISTKNGEITKQTAIETSNLQFEKFLAKQAEDAKRKAALQSANWILLDRVVLKNADGSLYDKVVELHDGGSMSINVAHNAKVAYFVDSTFYNEQDFKEILPQRFYALTGEAGVRNLDIKKIPDGNLHGYESVMYFWSKPLKSKSDMSDFKWEKFIPVK